MPKIAVSPAVFFPTVSMAFAAWRSSTRDYIVRLFRSLFFAQARNARTAERLWQGIDLGMIECLRAMGGSPYVVIGDSHVSRYLRRTSLDERWLAALPMVCDGGSAMRLADKNSRIGKRILQ
jgi:hypothetical protein